MTSICKHFYISGRVQGVFFRHHTHQQAQALGLKGWVKNLADGRVEVLVCGDAEKIGHIEQWLWEGPSTAHVSEVEGKELPFQVFTTFEVN